jgi:hypothetical protein
MKPEKMKGFLYVPPNGAPVLAYARTLVTLALPVGVRADDPRQPERASAVKKAAEGAPGPGLFHARVVLDSTAPARPAKPGGRVRFKVSRGRRAHGVQDEITSMTTRAKREGKRLTQREVKASREARALADALRAHVLPATTTTTTQETAP